MVYDKKWQKIYEQKVAKGEEIKLLDLAKMIVAKAKVPGTAYKALKGDTPDDFVLGVRHLKQKINTDFYVNIKERMIYSEDGGLKEPFGTPEEAVKIVKKAVKGWKNTVDGWN